MFSINEIYKILFILNYFKFKEKIFLRYVLLKVFIGYLGRYIEFVNLLRKGFIGLE